MFQTRSIAIRLILAISLTVAAACGILGTFSVMQERSLMRLALDQQLKLQYDSVIATLDYEGRTGLAVSAVLATLPPVAAAVVCLLPRPGSGLVRRGDLGPAKLGCRIEHVGIALRRRRSRSRLAQHFC